MNDEPTLADAAEIYYAAQVRSKALSEEREQIKHDAGFAASVLLNAVLDAGQKSKKFGPHTVHVAKEWDVYCTCCQTWANRCKRADGPAGVNLNPIYKIWISKEKP